MHDDNKEEQQLGVLALVSLNVEEQKRWCVADAVHTRHQSPLNCRRAFKEALRLSREHEPRGHEQERVDRDHDAEEAVPLDADQDVLDRCDEEEAPDERSVIDSGGRAERDEFAQGQKRDQREQNDRAAAAAGHCDREGNAHDPPRTHTGIDVGDRLAPRRRRHPPSECLADGATRPLARYVRTGRAIAGLERSAPRSSPRALPRKRELRRPLGENLFELVSREPGTTPPSPKPVGLKVTPQTSRQGSISSTPSSGLSSSMPLTTRRRSGRPHGGGGGAR
ncbi:hypothetical protein BH18ACT12_BH18ACT12_11980 [soil metagenome]